MERIAGLGKHAIELLNQLFIKNVRVRIGNGWMGWREEAPFHSILFTAAPPILPLHLCSQLVDGGCIVVPVGEESNQKLYRILYRDKKTEIEDHGACKFVSLILDGDMEIDHVP